MDNPVVPDDVPRKLTLRQFHREHRSDLKFRWWLVTIYAIFLAWQAIWWAAILIILFTFTCMWAAGIVRAYAIYSAEFDRKHHRRSS